MKYYSITNFIFERDYEQDVGYWETGDGLMISYSVRAPLLYSGKLKGGASWSLVSL